MRILVIFTGGTIGCANKDGWIGIEGLAKYELLERYNEQRQNESISFDVAEPYSILSENLSAKELSALINCVSENLSVGYDGIIVTHGTDTLSYSAAALSFAFSDVEIPVLLVSANYPLSDSRSNGLYNFIGACDFIMKKAGRGVFVSYKNCNESRVNIHKGTRISTFRESSSDLYSIDDKPYAFCEDGEVFLNKDYASTQKGESVYPLQFCENPRILLIDSYPANDYSYSLDSVSCIILSPYHSATIDTGNPDLKRFCERASERNIPVFLVNSKSGAKYESERAISDMKIKVLPPCCKSAIYVKSWIAVSKKMDIESFLLTPVDEEFCK